MITFLVELALSLLFELLLELPFRVRLKRKGEDPEAPEITDTVLPDDGRGGSMTAIKLGVGLVGGAAWGAYVATSTDTVWPLTFFSFLTVAAAALVLATTEISNVPTTASIENAVLRRLVTFTPERFTGLALMGVGIAVGIAVGFVAAGGL